MRFPVLTALLAAVLAGPACAQPDAVDAGLQTLWEALWHQSGTPTRLVRWEQGLKVRVHGDAPAADRQRALRALKEVAAVAGVPLADVSDRPDAERIANVDVEIVPDGALEDSQPCVTVLDFQDGMQIDDARVQMRAGDAARCAWHEAMHVMGIRGHPARGTVLSYFPGRVDGLLPLDRVLLQAWYSPRLHGGMTPFEVLPVLADQLVASLPPAQRAGASAESARFLQRTIVQMRAFADGRGDVPAIVRRSGKATDEGVRYGRIEMCYFLGVAYLQGTAVPPDPDQAVRWLQRAASLGSPAAQVRLGAATAARPRAAGAK